MTFPVWDAKLYNDKHSFVWEKAKGVIELLAAKPGEKILDIGCGTGHLTAEIAAKGAVVTGVDQSPAMIAEAKEKYPEIDFAVMDASAMTFQSEFDAVFSNAALHWIPDAEGVVRSVSRALKPGGRFVAEFGGKGNIRTVMRAIENNIEKYGLPRGPKDMGWFYPSIGEYGPLLEKHGLEVRSAELFERPTRLEDGERGLETWLRMFRRVLLDQMAAEKREAFLADVEHEARPRLFKDGVWELDYRRIRVVAVKTSVASD
jgi:trans-aconitate methyltransferase